jgi:hypothetical protein
MASIEATRRRRLEGRLLLEQGKPVLMLDGGGRWGLDLDDGERWLGQRVRIEGVRSGFDRIDVVAIAGPGESLEQACAAARRRKRRLRRVHIARARRDDRAGHRLCGLARLAAGERSDAESGMRVDKPDQIVSASLSALR